MSSNFKWVLLAVVCLIAIGFIRGLNQSPEEKAARAEQRAKSAEQEAQRTGRER